MGTRGSSDTEPECESLIPQWEGLREESDAFQVSRALLRLLVAAYSQQNGARFERTRSHRPGHECAERASSPAADRGLDSLDPSRDPNFARDVFGQLGLANGAAGDLLDGDCDLALRRYAERLKMLHETDRAILAARSPAKIAQAALERMGRVVDLWRGSVVLFDVEAGEAEIFAAIGGGGKQLAAGAKYSFDKFGKCDFESLCADRAVVVDDTQISEELRAVATAIPVPEVKSYVRVPLSTEGRVIGSLNLFSDRVGAFGEEAVTIARELAASLAIAIRQAQLFEEVKTSRESLTDLSRRLLLAEEDTRRRIATLLHDEIGQALTAVRLNLRCMRRIGASDVAATRLDESVALVEHTIQQLRGLSLDLRPALLDDLGLVPALRSYTCAMAERIDFELSFFADERIDRFDPEIETACFRVGQEAMTNIAKHAEARHVRVELGQADGTLSLAISDDGTGFDVAAATARASAGASLGLLGMRERASLLGGRFEIKSTPGDGTTIAVSFPVRNLHVQA
jgi:signal transduction histidine kinase